MKPTAKQRVLLLGDSTVLGSVPRLLAPHADHLEDVLRKLLAGDPGLPPFEVINRGEDNDTIQRMLATRYARDVAEIPGGPLDFIFIRFGINDRSYLADWGREFPATYHDLIARIRRDQPRAAIALETIIPYRDEASTREVNDSIRQIAAKERLPVVDTHADYAQALRHGPNMLSYRRIALNAVPAGLRTVITQDCLFDGDVIVLDNRLDAHLGDLLDWYADRHPNLAGFHVIAGTLARFLSSIWK